MTTRTVLTNNGREMIARFLARYNDWYPAGYRLYFASKWGEGGWEESGGIDVARDPELFVGNNDLEIIVDPLSYPGYSYATGLIPIDLATESLYNATIVGNTGEDFTTIISRLEKPEENNVPSYRFGEVGIFDNAASIPLIQAETGRMTNNMILYTTFDPTTKDATRALVVDTNTPSNP